jgi:UDP-2,4-diacetamido-2,4,6-trideoxy-beta-L-altropyranose hydrolase
VKEGRSPQGIPGAFITMTKPAMKQILFRADGNSKIGLGHLYRIFALIDIYRQDFDCLLLTKEGSATGIIPAAYHWRTIPDDLSVAEEPAWLARHYPPADTWLIADGYGFTTDYQKEVREAGYRLAYVDDLCSEYMHADLVINHALSVKEQDYRAGTYTRFALGTRYALLRPLFIKEAAASPRMEVPPALFICFGGADPLDLTCQALQGAMCITGLSRISVVVGAAYTHHRIFELEKTDPRIRIFRNLAEPELLSLMKENGFAVVPASNTLYELCAVKMPVLSGYYVDNQKGIYEGACEKKLVVPGGDFSGYTAEAFENSIRALIADTASHQAFMVRQAELFDGRIRQRFLDLLQEITYRKAQPEDMLQVYHWANDKLTRANSYFSEPIVLEDHQAWYGRRLKDERTLIYIAEVGEQPAGMVRYELGADHAVVGIQIGEAFRGRNLASVFLAGTASLYFKESSLPVLAYIKEENKASLRSFEKAGYRKLRNETVHGCPSYVYQLEKI